ncbi:NEDD8-conjugating protein ubc12 [Dinochytrium kinnereticum]|nr:NEDD8-conjugating protein ubc12 [Dinochytrium kinnereticum]
MIVLGDGGAFISGGSNLVRDHVRAPTKKLERFLKYHHPVKEVILQGEYRTSKICPFQIKRIENHLVQHENNSPTMLNIMSLKKSRAAEGGAARKPKTTAAQIRIQKDLAEVNDLPRTMQLVFPDPNDVFNFVLTIAPDEGFYQHGLFRFNFKINHNYPHEPPKVLCSQKIYHPNIDLEGNVCLNILREDWKPVLNLNSVLVGLQYLFLEPNADDPLNKAAAEVLRTNRKIFESNVHRSMRGGTIDGFTFDNVLTK